MLSGVSIEVSRQAKRHDEHSCFHWMEWLRAKAAVRKPHEYCSYDKSKVKQTRLFFPRLPFYRLHPSRYSRRTNLLASSRFVTLRFTGSHSDLCNVSSSRNWTRNATLPSSTDSASGPAQSKFEPGIAPPLHPRTHSW